MTAAEEIAAAVQKLRTARFTGAITMTPAVAGLVASREPIAKMLRETSAMHGPTKCEKHVGCDWCGDEDWPCNDVRNALAVARAVNGSQP